MPTPCVRSAQSQGDKAVRFSSCSIRGAQEEARGQTELHQWFC